MAGPGTRHRYQERADEELIFHYHNETERPTRAMTRNTHRTIFVMIASIGHVLRGHRHEFASADGRTASPFRSDQGRGRHAPE